MIPLLNFSLSSIRYSVSLFTSKNYPLPTLTIEPQHTTKPQAFGSQLASKINSAPGFFSNLSVVLDYSKVPHTAAEVVHQHLKMIAQLGIQPIGTTGLANSDDPMIPQLPSPPKSTVASHTKKSTKIFHGNVRSGNVCSSSENQNLVIIGDLKPGAEVHSDGSVIIF